jgi:hypothetical protein
MNEIIKPRSLLYSLLLYVQRRVPYVGYQYKELNICPINKEREDDIMTEERSQNERATQEELMARGPVSRGASNQSAPMSQDAEDQQTRDDHTTESTGPDPKHPDYNKMLQDNPTETPVGSAGPSKRDLGTVGGGTIPNTDIGPRGGMNTSDSTAEAGGTSARRNIGQGLPTDRGGLTDVGTSGESTRNANQVDRQAQSNIGERNPGQPQTSMGDRESPQGNRGRDTSEDIIDPMTSRAPDKLSQKDTSEKSDQKKES